MTTKLSLIIPAFNAEKFIVGTLRSITQQLTKEVELIVVNDGSTDTTASKVHEYFEKYISTGQLKLITQHNSGVSVARNTGISHSQGHYLGFVDADDYLMPDYMETLLSHLTNKDSDPDIIEFGFKVFKDNLAETASEAVRYSNTMFGLHPCKRLLNHVHAKARWYAWSRIFKRTLFDQKVFPPGVRFCEDLMIIPELYEDASTILVLDKPLYAYRFSGVSATFTVKQDYFDNLLSFYQTLTSRRELRFDYLRFEIANAIYSCNMKSGFKYQMPTQIERDLKKIRLNPRIYFDLNYKKILNLCYRPFLKKLNNTT